MDYRKSDNLKQEKENKKITIDEMKKHEWVVSWSGGKDSTATIILMHEYGIPIKEIIYVRMMYDDTLPATLPVMTDFVDEAKKTFESWGYNVRIIPSIVTAYQLTQSIYKRSKHLEKNGKKYGMSSFARGFCKFTGIKQKTIASINNTDAYEMIGYASDELTRINRLSDKKCSIMVELGIKEIDTFDICRKYNLLSPLYDLGMKRDGCWFCPNSAKRERLFLKENYPELIEKIKDMIEMCDYNIDYLKSRNNWVADYFSNNL